MKYVGISLKTYLSNAQTMSWLQQVATEISVPEGLELTVFPDLLLTAKAREVLPEHITVGLQGIDPFPRGPYTGGISAETAAELGVVYVEIAHAERREKFSESDQDFKLQYQRALHAGLTPWVCVGEDREMGLDEAVDQCKEQLLRIDVQSNVVIAYEPVWAIGAETPAPADYVAEVVRALRIWADGHSLVSAFLYGGSAGRGTYTELAGVVDGLFLGRRGHDVSTLQAVLDEVGMSV